MERAKLFWNGRSQAVRLPQQFRFQGDEVLVRREGEAVILEPVPRRRWPEGYWRRIDALRKGLVLPDLEPMEGTLLDLTVDPD